MLGVKQFADIYRGKQVLLTGHTGFKGSWLALWLSELGAKVSGVGLDPSSRPNHWDMLQLPLGDYRTDIRDFSLLAEVIQQNQPEIIFHLAAQPLVRRSYREPLETWATNVMGTANVLEACRHVPSVKAIVVITTDKCYLNREWPWGYRENDRLGGNDPYSASKAGAELVVASYRNSFFNRSSSPLLATARAGNVIGGGDWSEDRLIPDLIRAIAHQQALEIRSPLATRPWQHVLESLSGYLMLGQKLLQEKQAFAEAWNFGPEPEGNRTVSEVLGILKQYISNLHWHSTAQPQPHEATLLYLDNSKARNILQWTPVWNLETTLEKTAAWYQTWLTSGKTISGEQLAEYVATAAQKESTWTKV